MAEALKLDIYADFVGDQAFNDLKRRLAEMEAEFKRVPDVIGKSSALINDNFKAMHGQVGNIAAQFQDIGVQLAGGQSPFLIALQQGTQLGAVLGQTGGGLNGALKALGAGFASLVNPVNLAVIAGTALVGTAVQWATSSVSGTDAATDALKRHDEVLKLIKDRYPSIASERDKAFLSPSTLKWEEIANLKAYKKALDDFSKSLALTTHQLSMRADVMASPAGGASASAVEEWKRLKKAADDFRASGDTSTKALADFRDQIAEINVSLQDPTAQRYGSELYDVAKGAAQASQNVNSMKGTVDDLSDVMSGGIAKADAFAKSLRALAGAAPKMSERDKAWASYYEGRTNASDMGQIDQLEKALQKRMTELDTLDAFGGSIPFPTAKPNLLGYDPNARASAAGESDAAKFERAAAAIQKKTAALAAENAAFGRNDNLQVAAIAHEQALIQLRSQGVALTPKRLSDLDKETVLLEEQARIHAELIRQQQEWQDFRSGFESVFGSVASSLQNGTDAVEAFAKSLKNLMFQAAQRGIVDLLFGKAGGLPGGLFGGLFGGLITGKAEGGNVSAGSPYIVGEQGPELFFPGKSGSIAPASATAEIMSGGRSSIVYAPVTHVDARGADAGAVARIERGLQERDKALKTNVLGIIATTQKRHT